MFLGIAIGAVWIFHGLYSKLLNRIPRHRQIVGRILGEGIANSATKAIGVLEILLGVWALSGWHRVGCAIVQTLAIVAMNSLEVILARDLLISARGMIALNVSFLVFVWNWALHATPP